MSAEDDIGEKGESSTPTPASMVRRTSVTTYVPQGPPHGLDVDRDESRLSKVASSSSGSIIDERLRRRHRGAILYIWQILLQWEGRDRSLQLFQSTLLLVHSLLSARPQRISYFSPLVVVLALPRAVRRLTLRRIHLASESLANVRRILLLGRWLYEASAAMQEVLPKGTVGPRIGDGSEEKAQSSDSEEDNDMAERDQDEGVSSWRQKWRHRLEAGGEYLALLGEACDVAAFLGGSSILWRVAGGKVASTRQRRGLERIGVFFGLLSLLLSLTHVHLLRKEQRANVRQTHLAMLDATDNLEYEDEEAEEAGHSALLSGQTIGLEDAMRSRSDSDKQLTLEKPRLRDKKTSTSTAVEQLHQAEREAFLARKRMRHIGWEQTALRAEALFCLAEVLMPKRDHERLEAVTGTVSSLYGLAKIGGEARWGV